jgi:hypothetical protein
MFVYLQPSRGGRAHNKNTFEIVYHLSHRHVSSRLARIHGLEEEGEKVEISLRHKPAQLTDIWGGKSDKRLSELHTISTFSV